MESVTVVLTSMFLIIVLSLFITLTFNRVHVEPSAIARLVAEEIEDTYGYRVLSFGVNCVIVVNGTHVVVKVFGLEGSCELRVQRRVIPSIASGSLIVIYGNSTHVWISSKVRRS